MASSLTFAMVLSAVDKATAPLRAVAKSMDAVKKAGEGLGKAGASLRVARENVDNFTERMKAGLESITAPALEVDNALGELSRDVGPRLTNVSATLDNVKKSAVAWQDAHLGSAQEFIALSKSYFQAGLTEAQAIKATEAALRASTATGKDASAITSTLTILYKQMGDQTKDAGEEFGRLGDVLTRANQVFVGMDVAALADPLKDALPAAKASKVGIEQVVAVLGQLNVAGIKGGEAGASFAAVLQSMSAASEKLGFDVKKTSDGQLDLVGTLAGIEQKYGKLKDVTPEVAAKLQEAFGPAAFKAIAALSGQTTELSANLGKVQNSAGAAASAAASMEGTTSAQAKIAQQQVESIKLELAAGMLPAIQQVIPPLTDMLKTVGGFAKEHPKLVGIVGTIAVLAVVAGSVIGPLLSVGGALFSIGGFLVSGAASAISFGASFIASVIPALISGAASAWAFAAAMLANPITWIVLAIIALAAVIYIYWDPISKFFVALWEKIKVAFVAVWGAIKKVWDFAVAYYTGIWNALVAGVQAAWRLISSVWEGVAGFFGNLWAQIKGAVDGGISGILGLLAQFSPLTWIMKGLDAVTQWLGGFSLIEAGKNIVGTIVDGIKAMASAPVDAMKSIVQKVRNLLPFSPAKDGPLRDLHKVKLVETVAQSVNGDPLVAAMTNVAGDAMGALQSVPSPKIAAAPAQSFGPSAGSAAGGGTTIFQVTIQLGAGGGRSAVEELEAWLRDPKNQARLGAAIQAHAERENRKAF